METSPSKKTKSIFPSQIIIDDISLDVIDIYSSSKRIYSPWYQHYNFYGLDDKTMYAKCKICGRNIKFPPDSSTSNIIRHIKISADDDDGEGVTSDSTYLHGLAKTVSETRSNEIDVEETDSFDQNALSCSLVKFVVIHNLPITLFTTSSNDKGSSFQDLCKSFGVSLGNANGKGICYKKFRACVDSVFSATLDSVQKEIEGCDSKLSLIVDLSQLPDNHGSISSLALSYTASNMEVRVVDLGIRPYDVEKKSVALKCHIDKTLKFFKINTNKVASIVADKGSENTKIAGEFESGIIYRPCIAHSLHNSITRVCALPEISDVLKPFMTLITHIRGSSRREYLLKKIEKEEGDPLLHVLRTSDTRWVGILLSLVQMYRIQQSLKSYCDAEGLQLEGLDFELAAGYISILQVFWEATRACQSIGPSSLPLVMMNLYRIIFKLDENNNCMFMYPDNMGSTEYSFGYSKLRASERTFSLFDDKIKKFANCLLMELKYRFFWMSTNKDAVPKEYKNIKIISHVIHEHEEVAISTLLHPCFSSLWCPMHRELRASLINGMKDKVRSKLPSSISSVATSVVGIEYSCSGLDDDDIEMDDDIERIFKLLEKESKNYFSSFKLNSNIYSITRKADEIFKRFWNDHSKSPLISIVRDYSSIFPSSSYVESSFSHVTDIIDIGMDNIENGNLFLESSIVNIENVDTLIRKSCREKKPNSWHEDFISFGKKD